MRPVSQNAQFGVQPSTNFSDPPCNAASFEVNSEPHTGARPSARLCVGLIRRLPPELQFRVRASGIIYIFFDAKPYDAHQPPASPNAPLSGYGDLPPS